MKENRNDIYRSADDAEIVEAFKAGRREEAFNELVRRYSQKVLTLCSYYLKDAERACDISQEVFIKIYRSLNGFKGAAKLSTWIHAIAVNTCKNELSFWKRLLRAKAGYDGDPLTGRRPEGPEDNAFRSERARMVRKAIQGLTGIHRDIIILKDIQGFSYEEIGRILEITPGTVKSRLHRAREALADSLKDFWEETAG